MGKKHLSLIVIPHTKTSHRTLSFSKRTVRIVSAAGIVLGLALGFVTVDYLRMQFSGRSLGSLIAENQKQKESLQAYEKTIGTLEQKINAFQEYTGKLNIFAGIKSPDQLQNPGVGGGPADGGQMTLPSVPPAQAPPVRSPANIRSLSLKADDIQKNLSTLVSEFEDRRALFATTPSIAPTNGYHSSGFGWRIDPLTPTATQKTFHSGLDIATVYGSPVVATADGTVIRVARDGAYGLSVMINHGNGYTTLYGHLSSTQIRSGQRVKRGDEIGKVGHTGRALGDHVHYEVRLNGKTINPSNYILTEY
jgi:murein DD-endopeptidase MepM/ murein hydrolase activator NlpD